MERRILELAEYIQFSRAMELAAGDVARSTLCATAEAVHKVKVNPDDDDGHMTYKKAPVVDPDELLEGGMLRHIASDETEDRHGDIVSAKGWILDSYKKNPVVLWAHSHGTMPVGKNIDIGVSRKKLVGVSEYPSAKMYEFGNTAFRLAALGYMKAVSVGFIPLKFELLDEENPWGGVKTLQQDLLEYSIVPVPANPNALTLAAKGVIGFDVVKRWAEEVLDVKYQKPSEKQIDELKDALSHMKGNPVIIALGSPEPKRSAEEILDTEPVASKIDFKTLIESARLLDGNKVSITYNRVGNVESLEVGSPEPVSKGSEPKDTEDGDDDMKIKDAFLSDTRDHDEEKGIGIRIVDQDSPVILRIVDEPTYDVDEVTIQSMVTQALERRRGRLIDADFGG